MSAYFGGCWAPNIRNEHEPNIRMLRMLARSSFLVLLGPQRLVFPPCYHMIILSPDHSTKWLKSFSVPSPGPKHVLGCLPLRQGSLPKNKQTTGNNFWRRICQRGLKIRSPSKTSLFWNRPRNFWQKIRRQFCRNWNFGGAGIFWASLAESS